MNAAVFAFPMRYSISPIGTTNLSMNGLPRPIVQAGDTCGMGTGPKLKPPFVGT